MKPTTLSRDEFLAVIDDLRARVAANDSFAGSFEYEVTDGSAWTFEVCGCYRVGNSMGQGGVCLIGTRVVA